MGLIAIAANPASGRDIRRFVSSATVFNNREKQNIVERIILAAVNMGEHRVVIMPESYHFATRINEHLVEDFKVIEGGVVSEANMNYNNTPKDTMEFASYAETINADVLIVLGGDGTSRMAAKGISNIPLIPISTGTNNVFPEVIEGTVAGITAAAIASGKVDLESCCERCKVVDIYINGEWKDLALVDVVFSDYVYTGAKAIWQREDISRVVVTQCSPASIGFSAILGAKYTITAEDDCGGVAECGLGKANTKVSLAAGTVTPIEIVSHNKICLDKKEVFVMQKNGMLALDGEREITYQAGDEIGICIRKAGPKKVNVRKVLEQAQKNGFFDIN